MTTTSWAPIAMIIILFILVIAGAGMFALGFLVGRRSRAAESQRSFDVVSTVQDEKQH